MALIEREMPVNKVGQLLGENAHRIWTIFNHWIGLAYQADDPSTVTQLGFDETSRRKGHNYVTVAVDLEAHRVLHVVKGKDSNTIKEIKDYLEPKVSMLSKSLRRVLIFHRHSFRVLGNTSPRHRLPLIAFMSLSC